ncbi:hypothetical protein C5B89_06610 [Haloferax sp. Atlit-47N]|uniref:hypothetical protein n=1 Tax=Haloferax sp. Atlit-47N TaxID=2077199 RepID=UPI000E279346|nr:hypothetical protein [Haloferax sp. Atlit-47N]RDZ41608.1 hypothetical protein C5B89_06610 [Haloferax sp. Atlit-47N]
MDFYAASGQVYRPMNAYFQVNPISGESTTGTHQFKLFSQSIASMNGRNTHDNSILYDLSTWKSTDKNYPANEAAIVSTIRSLRATDATPVTVKYVNDSDAPTTAQRSAKFSFEVTNYE